MKLRSVFPIGLLLAAWERRLLKIIVPIGYFFLLVVREGETVKERKGTVGLVRVGEGGNGHDIEHTSRSRKPIGWAITELFWHQIELYVKVSLCERL